MLERLNKKKWISKKFEYHLDTDESVWAVPKKSGYVLGEDIVDEKKQEVNKRNKQRRERGMRSERKKGKSKEKDVELKEKKTSERETK